MFGWEDANINSTTSSYLKQRDENARMSDSNLFALSQITIIYIVQFYSIKQGNSVLFSSDQTKQQFNFRLQQSQIAQRTRLFPMAV